MEAKDNGRRSLGTQQTLAALITCRPLPFPSDAPSMIPGKSRICISAPPYSSTPGIAVRVVKEYAATSDFVLVILERKVDLPTEGKPTSAIRASPDFDTSKPEPAPAPAPGPGSRSCALRRASFLFQSQNGLPDFWSPMNGVLGLVLDEVRLAEVVFLKAAGDPFITQWSSLLACSEYKGSQPRNKQSQ